MPGSDAWQEWSRGPYCVTTALNALDLDIVHGFLSTTTWAAGLSRTALMRAVSHSLCFSLLEDRVQIGFARVITDYATYAYLCDVYVAEAHRGQGLGRWMMLCVLDHNILRRLKRISLLTHDAETFYRELGFEAAKHGTVYLERLQSSWSRQELTHEP
ncbi:GNAT family N-acetyltransferase [Silvibacterium dinghuense]|uniref:N-acetyltransferase n=1 Tax=Silvibacterium dinghuense TaxID=1560006 RepID=A0A4Q1SBY6_9BACT|nr:GNAT family N-acetyltransferase [Silvibacterium dinghuense]RXS94539.1 N-acetyltransferase [Silvibacterium dinghuense]GGH15484.1 N-acetyltransferase [Silvibacterium dinghuense]